MQKIYLVGFMGAGKSYWGRRWAAAYQLPFFETDDLVEEMAGMPISQIFEEKGEAWFRQQERAVITRLMAEEKAIISTGGGLPCFDNNMHLMNTSGITVFLEASPELLARRLSTARKKRPLLNDIPPGKLVDFITGRLAQRIDWYRKAQITLPVSELQNDSLKTLPGIV